MQLKGLHLLLTLQCTRECDHCFLFGSPRQSGAMTLEKIRRVLREAATAGSIEWIFFEGGEPFLFYPLLVKGVREADAAGFQAGIVSNAYWATTVEDALEWLGPMAGKLQSLSLSGDTYHDDEQGPPLVENAVAAADQLGIPTGILRIAEPEAGADPPEGHSALLYKGRAAENLSARGGSYPAEQFTECPCEDLRAPTRVHVDPDGDLHVCQGIVIGNLFRTPLKEICETYDADAHAVAGPLLRGGPVALAREYGLPLEAGYADACHLCFACRKALLGRFPEELSPASMYGE